MTLFSIVKLELLERYQIKKIKIHKLSDIDWFCRFREWLKNPRPFLCQVLTFHAECDHLWVIFITMSRTAEQTRLIFILYNVKFHIRDCLETRLIVEKIFAIRLYSLFVNDHLINFKLVCLAVCFYRFDAVAFSFYFRELPQLAKDF